MKRKLYITITAFLFTTIMLIGTTAYAGESEKANIANANISVASQAVYTGAAIEPYVTVAYNNIVLTPAVDYTVAYSNNVNAGTASVLITGAGNYTGAVVKTFNITPQPVSSIWISDRNTSSITINWSAAPGAAGYNIYYSKSANSGFEYAASTSSTMCKVSKLSNGTFYYFKVVAYASNKAIVSQGSISSAYAVMPAKVAINKVTKSGTTVKVNWKKTNCSGYQIQYTTDKKFKKGIKTIYVSASTKTKSIKKLNKKKVYYARVRAYVDSAPSKAYGSFSSKLSTNYSKLYATYSSKYVNNANRTKNLKIASKAINGTVIAPGETFSFNKVVGKRTTAKGYKKAHVFTGADSMTMGVGGGVCQVASTMFNTALIANVKIAERHQHSQRVSYVPKGRDAAIYWGSCDFKWKNNTSHPIKIVMKCSGGKITCSFYVCDDASPKKVKLKVTQRGKKFTLKRYVGGKVNYSCKSTY